MSDLDAGLHDLAGDPGEEHDRLAEFADGEHDDLPPARGHRVIVTTVMGVGYADCSECEWLRRTRTQDEAQRLANDHEERTRGER